MPAPKGTTLEGRFWSKVAKSDNPDGCWEWTACRFPAGYGQLRVARKSVPAHRVSWELHYGPIPLGLSVLHRCDNKLCIRPDHLFLGTNADNMADMAAKGRGVPGLKLHPERAARGQNNGNSRLTEDDVRQIKRRRASGATQRTVAREFGVSQGTVSQIDLGNIWRHVQHDNSAPDENEPRA